MEKHSEDQKLALRISRGESGAFKELVEHYQNPILNTCYRFILNREDAEDIAQEVFVEVYRSIRQFKGGSKLSTWIYRIAVNKSLDLLRKEKRKKRSSHKKESLNSGGDRNIYVADGGVDPEEKLALEQDLLILRNAVNKLPESQRIVFTLGKYDGISNKEIAEILGTSLSAVESMMHRAKVNLRKKLFTYFEKDLKRGGEILLLILFLSISHMMSANTVFNPIKKFEKYPQDSYINSVKPIVRGES